MAQRLNRAALEWFSGEPVAAVADALAAGGGEAAVAERLYQPDMPPLDLLVRTAGEQRLSNFLLWQIAYSEIHVTPVLWPDFGEEDLYEAVLEYQRRERRFGRVTR